MANRNEKYKAMQDKIAEYMNELADLTDKAKFSQEMQDYFEFSSKFHNYSWNNRLLIFMQKRNASRVAGFRTWQSLGRRIKKGEKGIMIFAPRFYKVKVKETQIDAETGEEFEVVSEQERIYFVPVYVFDVSQTEGKPLPELNLDYGSNTDHFPELLKAIETGLAKEGIAVYYTELEGDLYGYTEGKTITINSRKSVDDRLRTLIHEFAHFKLHFNEDRFKYSKKEKETHAEATSYVVCKFYNVPSKAFNYLALYRSDGEMILNSVKIVSRAVGDMIKIIEEGMTEIEKSKEKVTQEVMA